jgi:hypothetical protein
MIGLASGECWNRLAIGENNLMGHFADPMVFIAFAFFVWFSVGAYLSFASGWVRLARRYPGPRRPDGATLGGQVLCVGRVAENLVTFLTVANDGLYLSPLFLFRFMRRPVLVPWGDITHTSSWRLLWWRAYVLDLGGVTRLVIKAEGFRAVEPFIERGRAQRAQLEGAAHQADGPNG